MGSYTAAGDSRGSGSASSLGGDSAEEKSDSGGDGGELHGESWKSWFVWIVV
jgi:hypothetical protein